ncbi:hypothetical protein [Litorilituus lipolyticus]|uniref:DUF4177 domain-containing protein n=1 Tax=Litorilituus lipolyticus TaxID=2491017 RepID=A0A502KNQ2_9GAMM|nr:hypothetical protein [Litorilituus lipolyticus]TPH12884.1 hypothetical protein EPA86_15850 [Litorilituus lipolyticus]
MQRVLEFKKQSFWSNQIDMKALNEQIASLNQEGWSVKALTANTSFFGRINSYTILLELLE